MPVGRDLLAHSAHRVYGRRRLPRLLEGWEVVDVLGWFDIDNIVYEDTMEICLFILRKV